MFMWIINLLGLWVLLKALKHMYTCIWELTHKGYNWIERYGENSWAVVTGATDGIGWEFAREIAHRGLNVVLISRTKSKLENRCKELMAEFPNIKADWIAADFCADTTAEFYKDIATKLEDKDVSVLVNNVGLFATKIKNCNVDELRNAYVVNSLAQCMMTKVLIEKLYNREKRSAILNVGSYSSKCPTWVMAPYQSSKAVGANFMIGEAENHRSKVDFLACYPGYVATAMVAKRKKDFVTIDATECAQAFCRLSGVVTQSWGHWKHQIFCRSGAVAKWFFGWKVVLGWMYWVLRKVHQFQYGVKKATGDEAGIKQDLVQAMKTQHAEPHFVRRDTVTSEQIAALNLKTQDSQVSERTGENQSDIPKISNDGEIPLNRTQSKFKTESEMARTLEPELELKKTESCGDKIKYE